MNMIIAAVLFAVFVMLWFCLNYYVYFVKPKKKTKQNSEKRIYNANEAVKK